MSAAAGPQLTVDTLNKHVLGASYAVRGRILDRAMQLQQQLKDPKAAKLPFDDIIACNIGNPQALNQKPITFVRQVLSLVLNPGLIDMPGAKFPADVVARAKKYLASTPSVGAYSDSQGVLAVREEVAKFVGERDGTEPGDVRQIYLTNGASEAVRFMMNLMLRPDSKDGMLVPIPQYPLYSALSTLLQGELCPYYLDEARGWSLSTAELQRSLADARARGVTVRGLVVINPGNPTGQCLQKANMGEIVDLCARERLVLMADEVYQENSYVPEKPFNSFRKVAREMGYGADGSNSKGAAPLQLVSFHSTSKGFLGECGLRGGYMELSGVDAAVSQQVYKQASISLCSNVVGQLTAGLMVQPPRAGEESHALYVQERDTILSSLKRRANKLVAALNTLEGVTCNPAEGAMYAFPRVRLPARAVAAAKEFGAAPDEFYCLRMVEEAGIVTVPGSGFKQVEGTYHFRTTFLPPEDRMDACFDRLRAFHGAFMDRYR